MSDPVCEYKHSDRCEPAKLQHYEYKVLFFGRKGRDIFNLFLLIHVSTDVVWADVVFVR